METFSALLAICAGNSPVTGEFPAQRPVTWIFDVFFDLRLNKRLGKQSWGWWFETLWRPLWRHSNDYCCTHLPSSSGYYKISIPDSIYLKQLLTTSWLSCFIARPTSNIIYSTCVQIVSCILAGDSVLSERTGLMYPALSVSVNEICFDKEAANQIVSFNSCFSVVGWGGVVIRVTWKLVEFFSYFYRLLPRCVSLPSIPHRGGRCPKQASRQV